MIQLSINPDRLSLDEAYLQMAEVWAQRSKAVRLQVGALLVKNTQIISDGYNGMPTGASDDVCERVEWMNDANWHDADAVAESWPFSGPKENGVPGRYRLVSKTTVLHAESNVYQKLAKNGGQGANGSTLYCTVSPCEDCAKLVIQAGTKRVVFRHQYRLTAGVDLLREYGVEVVHLPKENHDD